MVRWEGGEDGGDGSTCGYRSWVKSFHGIGEDVERAEEVKGDETDETRFTAKSTLLDQDRDYFPVLRLDIGPVRGCDQFSSRSSCKSFPNETIWDPDCA